MPEPNLTERQSKWFASVRDSLEHETGKTLAEWIAIARTCPEEGHRARLAWLKDNYGLLQNRASHVLGEAFGGISWRDPDALIDTLWKDPASRAVFEAIDRRATGLVGVIRTARKGFTAWSAKVQFAAAKPVRLGRAMLGVALTNDASSRLSPDNPRSWSERLTACVLLEKPADVDDEIARLLAAARERS